VGLLAVTVAAALEKLSKNRVNVFERGEYLLQNDMVKWYFLFRLGIALES